MGAARKRTTKRKQKQQANNQRTARELNEIDRWNFIRDVASEVVTLEECLSTLMPDHDSDEMHDLIRVIVGRCRELSRLIRQK